MQRDIVGDATRERAKSYAKKKALETGFGDRLVWVRAGDPSAKMAADPKTDQRDPTGGGGYSKGARGFQVGAHLGAGRAKRGLCTTGGFGAPRTAHIYRASHIKLKLSIPENGIGYDN